MKKYFILIISFSLCLTRLYCQPDSIKIGAYRNSIDFSKNKTLYESDFIFKKKKHRKIPELYLIKSEDPEISETIIKFSIWGIYDGKSFYLNAERLGMTKGYIKIDKLGKYSYFRGIPIKSLIQKDRINRSIINFGMTGALVSNTRVAIENKDNYHYVLNIESGMINVLTKDYILRILQPFSTLLFDFQHEENNESIEIQLKYLDLVNAKVNQ